MLGLDTPRIIMPRTKTAGPIVLTGPVDPTKFVAAALPVESSGGMDPFRFWDPWYEKDPGWSGGDLKKARAAAVGDPLKTPTAERVLFSSEPFSVASRMAGNRSRGAPDYVKALLSGVDGVYGVALAEVIKLEAEEKAMRMDASKRAEKAFGLFGYGAFGKWAVETGLKWMDSIIAAFGGAAGHPEKIRANLENAIACYVSCVENALPPPLRNLGYTTLDAEYWQDTEKLAAAGCAYQAKMMALPAESVSRVRSWWALLTKNIKHSAVRDMLMFTSWGELGLAQDAQVYMVAVVVAAELGIDPRDFAIRLWNHSAGWQGAPSDMRKLEDGWVSNAAALQWDVLVRDAYTLGGISEDSKRSEPSSSVSLGTVAAAGLGLGVLAWLLFL